MDFDDTMGEEKQKRI